MDQEKIGKLIKEIRIKNNLTQKEFADILGVTYQAVSKWENGKNLPDIATLKNISNYFHVDIDELLNGNIPKNEVKNPDEKKSKKALLIWLGIIVLFIIILEIISHFHKNNFEFKTISTTCEEFTISGSAAYNNDKTSIYISQIDYCGNLDKKEYKKIECTFYEDYDKVKQKISDCSSDKDNVTLEAFLKDVKINVDNYAHNCKDFRKSNLYIEINATDYDNIITTYKIPIKLNDNC